jgi:ribosomal protein S12 methylthiotransferase
LKTHLKTKDTILVVTLGCAKNVVDSEHLMRQLSAHSIHIEHDIENSKARTVIINTCGFIKDAKQESIDIIVDYIQKKQNKKIDNLYVIGCLSERYADELRQEMPEVDKYFGVNDIQKIIESLGYNFRNDLIGERLLSTPSHFAYLKIAEGCNRKCSFCAIPLIRGEYKSIPVEDLIEEANFLAKKGVKELLIIAQDISYYGIDLYEIPMLCYLIQELNKIKGIEWIKLHYAYPAGFPKEILQIMNENPKVCKYLDIPFQHISDNMLKTMRRGLNKDRTLKLIEEIRAKVPEIALRTTILVGHPNETENDFQELEEFIKKVRFERLGVFSYSHEEQTYSSKKYKNSIPEKIKKQRAEKIIEIQKQISSEINESKVGKEMLVIIDEIEGDNFIGRTEFDSPEVDNTIIVKSYKQLVIGNFYKVKITGSDVYDLIGEAIV